MKLEEDGPLHDIFFLAKHPGWSYADLENAPDEIVAGLRLVDLKRG